jgi:hypothetical protein
VLLLGLLGHTSPKPTGDERTHDQTFILTKHISFDQYPKPKVFTTEGKRIVDAGNGAGVPPSR